MNRRGNQKYLHYENVRNRFAKDVGFNYRRGDSYSNRDNYRDERNQNKRERYDDRKIDYHRSGDRLKWDESRENRTGEIYGGRRARRDLESICEDNKKRQKLSENNNSNSSQLGELLQFSKNNKSFASRVANDPRLKNMNQSSSTTNN